MYLEFSLENINYGDHLRDQHIDGHNHYNGSSFLDNVTADRNLLS